jgi:hypothetical protein
MKAYQQVVKQIAAEKFEDRRLGITVNRFEALKTAAFIYDLDVQRVYYDVEDEIGRMAEEKR